MGTNNDDRTGAPSASAAGSADATASRSPQQGSRGKITTRPSRESILQSYASQDEMRALNARMYSQAASQSYAANAAQRNAERAARQEALAAQQREQEAARAAQAAQRGGQSGVGGTQQPRRGRVVPPLSSQESYDLTRSSQASYERARASRDALSEDRRGRALNREVIDGRGSIDSRTFNESHQISGYSRDERDRPDPMVDTMEARTTWRSRAGQGFDGVPDSGTRALPVMPRPRRSTNPGFSRTSVGGRRDYGAPSHAPTGMPTFLKVTIPVMIILLIVIIFLLLF